MHTEMYFFFVTSTCYLHNHYLRSESAVQAFCESIEFYNQKYNAETLGYVIMPNHFHFILSLRQTGDLARYMRDLKRRTSVHIRSVLLNEGLQSHEDLQFIRGSQIHKIWEDGYHQKPVYTTVFLQQKLSYIHRNPLQSHWKLSETSGQYPFSSAKYYETGKDGIIKVTHFTTYFEIPIGSP